ncbi:MAG: hypothetical protein ACRC7S_10655 [Cetobacterium sp.]
MKRIIVNEDNFILRVSNDFLMENTIMKPVEYILYLNIFRLIQRIEKTNVKNELYLDKDEYTFSRKDLEGIFNEQLYRKSNFDKILDGMIENQIEDIILNCEYNGKELIVTFDNGAFYKYFMVNKNYTTLDVKDFFGVKSTQTIKIIMLMNRFSNTGWVKIKEEDFRFILNKHDESLESWVLNKDIKYTLSKLSGKFKVHEFYITKCNGYNQYEFKFDSFKYIY